MTQQPRYITQEQFDHLPSDIHRLVARYLIKKGEWTLQGTGNKTGFSDGCPH